MTNFHPTDRFNISGEEPLPDFHPKVLVFEKALQNYKENIEDVSVRKICFPFPVEVILDTITLP